MSNSNYMDNVPVKISENYRPLRVVYQLPQAIAHKIALPANHYETAPQYKYDFQLEHILLQKLPEWRHVRQREREARRERIQNRERERQRLYESQQKALLGAVNYPSTEDLSSCSSDEGVKFEMKVAADVPQATVNNFNNILQPTILTPSVSTSATANGGYIQGSFNYQDFESSSSPFDECELKTINDLDILAQVLHNTQIETHSQLDKKPADDEEMEKQADSPEIEAEKKEAENIPNTATISKADIISSHINYDTTIATFHHLQNNFTTTTAATDTNAGYHSKSVPDILNVLKEETLKSERINRIRNYSEVLMEENQSKTMNKTAHTNSADDSKRSTAYYNTLDEKSKQMVKNISSMGFSLEQVSRIALLYEADEKKIIEHLICLNELRVLGFEEENISNALLKCENDKEKALEFLIS